MCIQVVERYAVCRCLYYKHEVDASSTCKSRGHKVQTREVSVGYSCATHSPKGIRQTNWVELSDLRRRGIDSPSSRNPDLLEESSLSWSSLRSTKSSDFRQHLPDASEHASKTGLPIAGPPPPAGKSLLAERFFDTFSTVGQASNDELSAAESLTVPGKVPQTEGQASSSFTAFSFALPPSAALKEQPFSSGREGKSWSPSRIHQTEVIDKIQAAQMQTDIVDGEDDTVSPDSATNSQLFGNTKEWLYRLSIFGFDFSVSVTTELGSPQLLRNCSIRIEKPLVEGRKRIRWRCVSSHRGYCCGI